MMLTTSSCPRRDLPGTPKSSIQVGPQILHALNPDAQSKQRGRQVLLAVNARPALNCGLHGTQARGVLNEPEARTYLVGCRSVAANIK